MFKRLFEKNQKNERIISFQRNTLFPRIENIEQKVQKNVEHSELEKILWNKTDDRIIPYTSTIPSSKGRVSNKAVEKDDLILHDAMRHIGESENLMFTTLYRNTHPIHFNYMRYKPEQIIVCGGFVMAIVLGNAMKDFKQVISQKVINCSHINKVNPGDSLSAASYVYGKVTNGNVETLKMVTLGFIEVDPAKDLLQRDWPIEIFSADTPKPKILEEFLKVQFPELFHKICIHINWEVSRFIV